jgi:hypothetical protein
MKRGALMAGSSAIGFAPATKELRDKAQWYDNKALQATDGRIVGMLKDKANALRSQADIIEKGKQ